jgi:hypothetical protein
MVVIAFRSVPELSIRPARPTSAELRLLYGFGLQSFFVLVAFKLISYTDTAVITVKLGLVAAGLYTPALQVVEYARMCVGGFAGVFAAETHRARHAEGHGGVAVGLPEFGSDGVLCRRLARCGHCRHRGQELSCEGDGKEYGET